MMRRCAFALALMSPFALVPACAAPTEMTLHLTTNVACPVVTAHGIDVAAGNVSTITDRLPAMETSHCVASADPSSLNEVGHLVIVPTGDKTAAIAIRVVAGVDVPVTECSPDTKYKGCIVERFLLPFVENQNLRLEIRLTAQCKDVACDELTTCADGQCVSASVACQDGTCSSAAATGDSGAPETGVPMPDAGVDARVDADAAIADAASPMDSSTATDASVGCGTGPWCDSASECCHSSTGAACQAEGLSCMGLGQTCRSGADCAGSMQCCVMDGTGTDGRMACVPTGQCGTMGGLLACSNSGDCGGGTCRADSMWPDLMVCAP